MKTETTKLVSAMALMMPLAATASNNIDVSGIESLNDTLWSVLVPLGGVIFAANILLFAYRKFKEDSYSSYTPTSSYRNTIDKKEEERPVTKNREYDFIKKYSVIDTNYSSIKDFCNKVQNSNASEIEKKHADKLKGLAHKVLDGLNELNMLGKLDGYETVIINGETRYLKHTDKAVENLRKLKNGIFSIIQDQAKLVNESLNSITLPDAKIYEMQIEFVRLKNRGKNILGRLDLQDDLAMSEDKLLLHKIVNTYLDDLSAELDNLQGNKASLDTSSQGLLNLYQLNRGHSDSVIENTVDDIVTDIKKIYDDIENSLSAGKRSQSINNLLIASRYYANR